MTQPPHRSARPFGAPPRRPQSRIRRVLGRWRLLVALVLVVTASGLGAVSTNALGAGDRFEGLLRRIDRFVAGPVPDRSTKPTVVYTPPPVAAATATPTARTTGRPTASVRPTTPPTPTPPPPRVRVDVNIAPDADRFFAHQIDKDWCAVAGVQMVLAIHGRADTSASFQRKLASRVREWESWADSHNGNWGPAAMSLALEAYGVPGYEIRAYAKRDDAMRDAGRAIALTNAPAILLTWRGAHTWVMTGFRADADPTVFNDAKVSGAYILDPWYPSVSSIWGPSNPPGFFTKAPEMRENYLPWKRPEGRYPDRDGKFIAVVPTLPRTP